MCVCVCVCVCVRVCVCACVCVSVSVFKGMSDSAPESSERGYCMHEYGNRHLTHDALVTTDNGVLATINTAYRTIILSFGTVDNLLSLILLWIPRPCQIYVSQTNCN